jgi:hypothetical protein
MSESEMSESGESGTSLREQMTEGMERIRQQLDLLRSGPNIGGPSDDRSLIADLEAELQALSEARENLGPEGR